MKYYVVFDTNVLVSAALKKDSVPGLTGPACNKHFPEKPFIVTPRQLLDIVLGDIEDYENEKV